MESDLDKVEEGSVDWRILLGGALIFVHHCQGVNDGVTEA
jgi:hypothetical protein